MTSHDVSEDLLSRPLGGDEGETAHAPCVRRGCVNGSSHLLDGSVEAFIHSPRAGDASLMLNEDMGSSYSHIHYVGRAIPLLNLGAAWVPGREKHCSHSPAARIVQGVAAPDLFVDPPVVMTRVPVLKNELAGRPGA